MRGHMLDQFKRWMSKEPEGTDAKALSSWAKTHGHLFKTVRNEQGGVVECHETERHWRIEWGAPQRIYIEGSELRLREELGISPDLQLMLISRTLAMKLETDVFERFTEAMQTQIDHTLPEEMRWLAMFPRVSMGEHKALKARYQLQSPATGVAQAWLDGELADALLRASGGVLQGDPSFVILMLRGRLYLRMQAPRVDAEMLDAVDNLFGIAARRARVVAAAAGRTSAINSASDWPSTSATAWQSQLNSEGGSTLPPTDAALGDTQRGGSRHARR